MHTGRFKLLLQPKYRWNRAAFSNLERFHPPNILDGRFQGFKVWRVEGCEPPRCRVGDVDLTSNQPGKSGIDDSDSRDSKLTSNPFSEPRSSKVFLQNSSNPSVITLSS